MGHLGFIWLSSLRSMYGWWLFQSQREWAKAFFRFCTGITIGLPVIHLTTFGLFLDSLLVHPGEPHRWNCSLSTAFRWDKTTHEGKKAKKLLHSACLVSHAIFSFIRMYAYRSWSNMKYILTFRHGTCISVVAFGSVRVMVAFYDHNHAATISTLCWRVKTGTS